MSLHHWLPVIYTVHCRVLFNSSQCFTACLKVALQKKVTAGAPERCSESEVGSRAPGLPWGQGDSELPKLVAPELGLCRWDWERGQEVGPDRSAVSCRLQCCCVLEHPTPPVSEPEEIQGIFSSGTTPGQAALPPGGVSSPRTRSLCTPRAEHGDGGVGMALLAGHRGQQDSHIPKQPEPQWDPCCSQLVPAAPTAHLELWPCSQTGAVGDIELDALRREG